MAEYVATDYWVNGYAEGDVTPTVDLDPRFIATTRVRDVAVAFDDRGNIE